MDDKLTTTDHDNAAAIAAGLSERQIKYLTTLAKGGTWEKRNLPPLGAGEGSNLEHHRLIEYKGKNGICDYFAITDLGKRILEATREPAAAGKPATISAREFVEQGYSEKIAMGECDVATYYGQKIRSLTKRAGEDQYMIWPLDDKQIAGFLEPDSNLFVTWLTPPQPVSAQVATATSDLGSISTRVWQEAPYWCYEVIVNGEVEVFGHGYHSSVLAQASADDEAKRFQQPVPVTAEGSEAELAEVYHCFDDEMTAELHWYGMRREAITKLDLKLWENHKAIMDELETRLQQALTPRAEEE